MKILFIITDFGSFNNFLGEVSVALSARQHEITVICSETKVISIEDKFDYKFLGIKFYFVDFPRGFNFFKHYISSKRIHSLIDILKPDVISAHFTTGIFTFLFLKKSKILTLGTFHGLGFPVLDSFIPKIIFKSVEYFCFSRLNQIWVINLADFNLLKRTKFKNKTKFLQTKGVGCDLKKFDPTIFCDDEKIRIRESLGIAESDFVIVFTGRYVSFKGYDKVIRAFRIIKKNYRGNRKFKLITIGGRDSIHPTGLTLEEKTWIAEDNNIIDIGFTRDVEIYLSISNVFIFPSLKEGMPVSIIEALAMEVPVITTDSRGCSDLIINDYNGLLLSVDSIDLDFAKAVIKVSEDLNLVYRLKKNIRKNRLELSRENFIKQQLNLFEKIT